MRTIVDAALYKNHTGVAWRELPAEFGSWQTASRRHRQLIASYQWDEITQVRNSTASPHIPTYESSSLRPEFDLATTAKFTGSHYDSFSD